MAGNYVGEDYLDENKFNPKEYMVIYPGCGEEGCYPTINKKLVSWIDEELSAGNFTGQRMADICTGPVMVPSIFFSRNFKEIFLFEYTPQCRREVTKWLNADKDAIDWSSFVQDAANLEKSTPKLVEERTRSCVKKVSAIDLTTANPMPEELVPFDLIYSAWTLEAVAKTDNEYKALVSKCGCWLRPGGTMLLMGSFNQDFYTVEANRFHSLMVSEDLVRSAFDEAGFEVRRTTYYAVDLDNVDPRSYSNSPCIFFMSAVKRK